MKNEYFPICLLRNPINVCWNPQSKASFSKTIELRGHMLRFTVKWMFSHLSPWEPHKCVLKPSTQTLFSQDDQFEGSPAYVYLQKECFHYLSPWKPHECMLKPSEQGSLIFTRWSSWGVKCLRFTCKMNVFLSISLETPWMYVGTLRTGIVFLILIDLRGHMPRFTLKVNIFPSISLETQ